jgi:exosortase/archaeosortase family protein
MIYGKVLGLRVLGAMVLVILPLIEFDVFYHVFSWLTVMGSFLLISLFHGGSVHGMMISVGGHLVELIPACIASAAYVLLVLLVLLTKGISLKKGVWMFVVGSLLILMGNIIRIEVLVMLLLGDGVNYFETLHILMWKIVSSVYVVGVWIFLSWKFKVKTIPVWSDVEMLLKRYH